MKTIGFKVPDEVVEKYHSLPPEKKMQIYKSIQSIIVSMIEGRISPEDTRAVYNIRIESCRDGRDVRQAQKLYIYVIEALKTARELIMKNSDIDTAVRSLRKILAAISLNAVDKKVETKLRELQKSFRKLIDIYIEKREEDPKKILEEIEAQLTELRNYLLEKYPVF